MHEDTFARRQICTEDHFCTRVKKNNQTKKKLKEKKSYRPRVRVRFNSDNKKKLKSIKNWKKI